MPMAQQKAISPQTMMEKREEMAQKIPYVIANLFSTMRINQNMDKITSISRATPSKVHRIICSCSLVSCIFDGTSDCRSIQRNTSNQILYLNRKYAFNDTSDCRSASRNSSILLNSVTPLQASCISNGTSECRFMQ